jgi:hypothetical protein
MKQQLLSSAGTISHRRRMPKSWYSRHVWDESAAPPSGHRPTIKYNSGSISCQEEFQQQTELQILFTLPAGGGVINAKIGTTPMEALSITNNYITEEMLGDIRHVASKRHPRRRTGRQRHCLRPPQSKPQPSKLKMIMTEQI